MPFLRLTSLLRATFTSNKVWSRVRVNALASEPLPRLLKQTVHQLDTAVGSKPEPAS